MVPFARYQESKRGWLNAYTKGHFVRWGSSGKKYYYDQNAKESRQRAKRKAQKQAAAIHANKKKKRK